MSNRDPYYAQVAQFALAHLDDAQAAQAQSYVRAIVDRWLDQLEDGDGYTPQDIINVERGSFESRLADTTGAARVDILHQMALDSRVTSLSKRALKLAMDTVDNRLHRPEALAAAADLDSEIDSLMKEVSMLPEKSLQKPLARKLADAGLEIRYIRDGGAMSIRLNRYIEEK